MSITVTKDTSVWKKLKKDFIKQNNDEMQLGFFEDSRYGAENSNLPVAQIAQWNNEGHSLGRVPPRPFFTNGFLIPVEKGIYDSYFKGSIRRILEGGASFKDEYKKLGPMMVEDLQNVIDDWDSPPNAPLTIELKGFDDPLIKSGTMRESVSYRVEKD